MVCIGLTFAGDHSCCPPTLIRRNTTGFSRRGCPNADPMRTSVPTGQSIPTLSRIARRPMVSRAISNHTMFSGPWYIVMVVTFFGCTWNLVGVTEHQPIYAVCSGNMPAVQFVQLEDPPNSSNAPLPHDEQLVLPVKGAYLPASHVVQLSASTLASVCASVQKDTNNAIMLAYRIIIMLARLCGVVRGNSQYVPNVQMKTP